jgi:hypothetical protein
MGLAVSIFSDHGMCWDALESELVPIGKRVDPKKVFSNKFHQYDVVKIFSPRKALAKINNCEGHISGMSQDEVTEEWGYAVSVPEDGGLVWSVPEKELLLTGRKVNPKDFMTNIVVRVSVDPETSEGKLVEPDEDE